MYQYEDYVKKSEETLIITASNSSDNIRTNKTIITRKQKWKEKTTAWIFRAKNWRNLKREELDMVTKEKLLEIN